HYLCLKFKRVCHFPHKEYPLQIKTVMVFLFTVYLKGIISVQGGLFLIESPLVHAAKKKAPLKARPSHKPETANRSFPV
ncbi:hypothetical protein, partial [Brevibacillus borstelensis]|uniref:hypothetical protein n=1 Tax=Brevibacillus borstelensis TaxID=45462 RepID=UPI001E5BFA42